MSGDDLSVLLFFLSLAAVFGVEAAARAELTSRRVAFAILGVACALTGIFWLHIKQIWPPFAAATASVATNPLAWFVIVMFTLAVFAFRPQGRRPFQEPKQDKNEKREDRTNKEKIFIDSTPAYILGLYKNVARIQADKLVERYIGKWMRVTGTVSNIYENYVSLNAPEGDWRVFLNFDDDRKDIFHLLELNKSVTAIGEIRSINPGYVDLYDCTLIPAASLQAVSH